MYEDVKTHLQEMLDFSVIQPVGQHSGVSVKKKDGSLRFCIDLRTLNNQTVKDAYSLSQIAENLDSLQESQWFSSLDLKSGYWQVEIDESKPLTTFTVGQLGFYKCQRMSFGLTIKLTDPVELKQLLWECNHLKWRKGILHQKVLPRDSQKALFQLLLLTAHRETALKGCHDEIGHIGPRRMLDLMCNRIFWPQLVVQAKGH